MHGGVALEHAVQLPELEVLHLRLEIAPLIEGGVKNRAGVPLGQDQAVTVLPIGVGRVDAHDIKIQGRDDIRDGQGRPGMAVLPFVDHPHCLQTQTLCYCVDFFIGHLLHSFILHRYIGWFGGYKIRNVKRLMFIRKF